MGETFGEALKRLRTASGMSLRVLGERVPYDFRYLSDIERGRREPNRSVAEQCGRALGAEAYLVALAAAEPSRAMTVPERQSPAGLPVAAARWIDVGELVMAAAHESTDAAANDGGRVVPPETIEQVRADVHRLARGYNTTPPLQFLGEARRIRDLASRLADRTRRPAQASDLYLTSGQVCALMSVASFDLAVWPAAIEQARAAFVYAEMVDHAALRAWARGMQALTAYWCGQAREAVDLADAGLRLAPAGTARARLHSILARAWSHLGSAADTRAALASADADRDAIGETGADELHDGIAGEFGWGPARQAMCSASALLRIGDADAAAERAAQAIELRPSDSTGSLVDMTARADLAYARLAQDRLDAAEDALAPVWDLAPEMRRHSLVGRLVDVVDVLAQQRYRTSTDAVALRDRIEAFTADSAPKALPPGLA